jgi:hypothetical protein
VEGLDEGSSLLERDLAVQAVPLGLRPAGRGVSPKICINIITEILGRYNRKIRYPKVQVNPGTRHTDPINSPSISNKVAAAAAALIYINSDFPKKIPRAREITP